MAAAEIKAQSISNGAIAEGIYSLANTSKRYMSRSSKMIQQFKLNNERA
jgi:hypothetical protein